MAACSLSLCATVSITFEIKSRWCGGNSELTCWPLVLLFDAHNLTGRCRQEGPHRTEVYNVACGICGNVLNDARVLCTSRHTYCLACIKVRPPKPITACV